jgi:DNA-binding transcriptional regulator YhcF (GntR family)
VAQQVGESRIRHENGPEAEQVEELPVGLSLAWRLRALILSGRLPAGDRLPGVRDFAAAAGVNVNTARALYRRLESEGLVVSQHGSGTFVAAEPLVAPDLERIAADAARSAREIGIEPRELARALYAGTFPGLPEADATAGPELADFPATPEVTDPASERAARRSLRDQVARLEAELAAYPEDAAKAGIAEAAPEPLAGPTARVADIGELEAVRDQLIDRLKRIRGSAAQRGDEQRAARRKHDAMVEDPAAHKWEKVSGAEMGDPGCASYQVGPAWGPIGALMNWWKVKVSGGCPLAGPLSRLVPDGQSGGRPGVPAG